MKLITHNNDSNFCLVKLSFLNPNISSYLTIIKDLPVKKYIKDKKSWMIPIIDLPKIIKRCRNNNLPFKINDQHIKKQYKNIKNWKINQKRIKNIDIENKDEIKEIYDDMNNCLADDIELYKFQVIGAYFLYQGKTSLLCDMVGLGKTVQAITALEKYLYEGITNFNIILCPSTLKKNWYNEIQKFTNSRKALVISGNKAHRKMLYKRSYKYQYMILNYDLLMYDMELLEEFVFGRNYKLSLTIDEIQYIKNKSAKRTKLTRKIAEKCSIRFGLSATIVENTVLDLFSSFQVIDKTIFGDDSNYINFMKRYCKFDFFGIPRGYKNADEIKKRIAPYYIRRFKEDVLDELPDRVENNYWIQLSPLQRDFYNKIKDQIVDELKDQEKATRIRNANVLSMMNYLKQSTISAKLVGHKDNISTKTTELFNLLESINKNSKIIVFCHYTDMVEILSQELSRKGINYLAMHGNRKKKHYCKLDDRVDKIINWDDDDKMRVLLTSDILREGVNILSANYLVNFDLLWNPAKMEQRIGRFDRIGNKHKVINIINFIAEDTIEEKIYKYLFERKEMSKDIIDSGKTEQRIKMKDIYKLIA
jgi:SNF2 family DNA or RNA helicase